MIRPPHIGRTLVRLLAAVTCLVVAAAALGFGRPRDGSDVASAESLPPSAASMPPTHPSGTAATAATAASAIARTPVPSSGSGAVAPSTSDGVVPGTVNATSINLSADYVATVRLNFGTRTFLVASTMTVTNTSGIAIDRLELNTIAARLGQMTLTVTRVDDVPVHATVTD